MREVRPFMALMKELSFISGIHIPKPEVFCKVFKKIKFVLLWQSLTNYHQEQNISLLSIIIYKALYIRMLYGCVVLVHKNKQRGVLLIHSTKHYSSIYEENYLDGD